MLKIVSVLTLLCLASLGASAQTAQPPNNLCNFTQQVGTTATTLNVDGVTYTTWVCSAQPGGTFKWLVQTASPSPNPATPPTAPTVVVIPALTGTSSGLPTNCQNGQEYYAIDTKAFYVCSPNGVWTTAVNGGSPGGAAGGVFKTPSTYPNPNYLNTLPAVPAQASNVGYNTLTFSSAMSSSEFDLTNSYASGFKWYGYNFSLTPPTSSTLAFSPGYVTMTSVGAGWSMCGGVGSSFVGTAMGSGAYFEATVAFDPVSAQAAGTASGWPSLAIYPIESSLGVTNTAAQWVGQATNYNLVSEIDPMEYDLFGTAGTPYGGTVHTFYGIYGTTCSPGYCDHANGQTLGGTSTSFGAYHQYGALWVPATNSTNGYVQFYLDGAVVGNAVSYPQFINNGSNLTVPPTVQVMDYMHYFAVFGTSSAMSVRSFNVWQASATNNVRH